MFSVLVMVYLFNQRGEREFLTLLNGDQKVNILSLETRGQQRQLLCTDTEVLRYFKDILVKHTPELKNGVSLGGSGAYKGYFRFEDGGTYDCYLYVGTHGFALSVASQAAEEGHPTHSIMLISPVPEKVRQIFDFLNEPYQNVAGTFLVLEDGKAPQKKYDAKLVAK